MKCLAIILVSAVILISGCAQGNDNTKMLEAPEKARNEADKASEKVQDAVDAIEGINTRP
ncbi:MAG: hypothetical protein KAX16_05360 [Actinomycetia bacterium]|nr:hypothetical protein [Actinomycetes bacterium]